MPSHMISVSQYGKKRSPHDIMIDRHGPPSNDIMKPYRTMLWTNSSALPVLVYQHRHNNRPIVFRHAAGLLGSLIKSSTIGFLLVVIPTCVPIIRTDLSCCMLESVCY